jgi:hypothetical protein
VLHGEDAYFCFDRDYAAMDKSVTTNRAGGMRKLLRGVVNQIVSVISIHGRQEFSTCKDGADKNVTGMTLSPRSGLDLL